MRSVGLNTSILVHGAGVTENIPGSMACQPVRTSREVAMISAARLLIPLLLVLVVASGCNGAMAGESIGVPSPDLPSSDGLLQNAELQSIVGLQVERNGPAIQDLLDSPDAVVRARAALALASVQDPTALDGLEGRLADPSPEVRQNAAFALGQLALLDGGASLIAALGEEENRRVRARLIEAVGKRGGSDVVAELTQLVPSPGEEAERTLAVARAALREVRPAGVLEFLLLGLTHSEPDVRSRSAYYFGRAASVSAWSASAARVRAALDSYAPEEPAAMDLVQALGRLRDVEQDAGRIARSMSLPTDWRTRTNAARSVMSPQWLESSEIREALVRALDDPSEHVRIAAATSITLLMWTSEEYLELGAQRIHGPQEDWRAQASFAAPLAAQGAGDAVVDWTRRMAGYDPAGAVRGIESIGGLSPGAVIGLLFELADHPEALVRAAAINALTQRLARGATGEEPLERFYALFVRRLRDAENLPASRAAFALSNPSFASMGAETVLEEAFATRRDAGDSNILVPILESMGSSSLALLREVVEVGDMTQRVAAARALERLTGEQVPIGGAEAIIPLRTIDWQALSLLGPAPRVRMETDRGEIVVRLFPEQAPLSVQAFVDDVRRGAHDGTRFHRVVSNFVAQGGDFGMGDGSAWPATRSVASSRSSPFSGAHSEWHRRARIPKAHSSTSPIRCNPTWRVVTRLSGGSKRVAMSSTVSSREINSSA